LDVTCKSNGEFFQKKGETKCVETRSNSWHTSGVTHRRYCCVAVIIWTDFWLMQISQMQYRSSVQWRIFEQNFVTLHCHAAFALVIQVISIQLLVTLPGHVSSRSDEPHYCMTKSCGYNWVGISNNGAENNIIMVLSPTCEK